MKEVDSHEHKQNIAPKTIIQPCMITKVTGIWMFILDSNLFTILNNQRSVLQNIRSGLG